MVHILPSSRQEWETAIQEQDTKLEPLSSDYAFHSGSKFSKNDFLRLRILHKLSKPANLYHSSHHFKDSVKRITKLFDESEEIRNLRVLIPNRRSIESWTHAETHKAGRFAVGLEHLSTIANSADENESEEESSTQSVSSRIINSPRVRKQRTIPSNVYNELPSRLSQARIDPQSTPTKSVFPATERTFLDSPPSASTAQSKPSPMNQNTEEARDLQAAIDSWKREMYEATRDEQTVNAYLVALIIPMASMLGCRGRVRLDRKPFQVLGKNVRDDKALYEARVDGIILDSACKDIQAFMEVKRDLRGRKEEVRMQEGAQMAAFDYSKGSTTKAKSEQWMISMNGYEGYITIATYSKDCVNFLLGDRPLHGNTSFMVMREFGPFDLRHCQELENHGLESFLTSIAVLMGL